MSDDARHLDLKWAFNAGLFAGLSLASLLMWIPLLSVLLGGLMFVSWHFALDRRGDSKRVGA